MRKLTNTQAAALAYTKAVGGTTTGYDLKRARVGNLGTLQQLASRGLVTPVGVGHMATPASASFTLTPAGRAYLEARP